MKLYITIFAFLLVTFGFAQPTVKFELTGDNTNFCVNVVPEFTSANGSFAGGNVVLVVPTTMTIESGGFGTPSDITSGPFGTWTIIVDRTINLDGTDYKYYQFTNASAFPEGIPYTDGTGLNLFCVSVDDGEVAPTDEIRLLDQIDHLTPSTDPVDNFIYVQESAQHTFSAGEPGFTSIRDEISTRDSNPTAYNGNLTSSTVPITLLSFDAEKIGPQAVQLDWTSATEINSSHFEVERSEDAENWDYLGTVQAAGNSYEPIDYGYVDRTVNLKRNETKIFYYRLKQVDLDGFTEYSEIRGVRMEGRGFADISFFPNPTSDIVNIDIASDIQDGTVRYQIHDVSGKKLIDQVVDISVQRLHTVNLRSKGIDAGVYLVRVLHNSEIIAANKVVLVD